MSRELIDTKMPFRAPSNGKLTMRRQSAKRDHDGQRKRTLRRTGESSASPMRTERRVRMLAVQ